MVSVGEIQAVKGDALAFNNILRDFEIIKGVVNRIPLVNQGLFRQAGKKDVGNQIDAEDTPHNAFQCGTRLFFSHVYGGITYFNGQYLKDKTQAEDS